VTTTGIGSQSGGRRGHRILPIRGYYAVALLAGLVGIYILYFWRLGVCPLLPPNEGLYSEIAREMNETGDYLTPHLNHLRYYEKPPLFYWCTAASFRLLGVSEASARLVSALSGVGTIFLTMLMGSLLGGKRLGALSGVIVGSSLGMMGMCRLTMFDPLLTLWVTLAFLGFTIGYISPRRAWGYPLCSAAFALALMTKGPVALMIGVPPMLAFITLTGGWRRWREMMLWQCALIFVAIAAPWHIAVSLRDPNFAHFYFINETIDRFIGTRIPADYRTDEWYFYLTRTLLLFAPWSLLLPLSIVAWPRKLSGANGRETDAASRSTIAQLDAWADPSPSGAPSYLLAVLWFVWPLTFFSIATNKANYYLLPTFPAQALLVGRLLSLMGRARVAAFLPRRLVLVSFALMVVMAPIGLYLVEMYPHRMVAALDPIARSEVTWALVVTLALWVVGGLQGVFARGARSGAVGSLALSAVSLALAMGLVVGQVPDEMPSSRLAAAAARQYAGDRVPVLLDGPYEQRATVGFYLHRRLVCINGRNGDLWFGSTLEPCDEWFPTTAEVLHRARHGEKMVLLVPAEGKLGYWLARAGSKVANRGLYGDLWVITVNM